MQAIETKFFGPTNNKGARIKATCAAGSVFVPYGYEYNTQDSHWQAVKALIVKLGWQGLDGKWICGGNVSGTGFVFVNDGIRSDNYTMVNGE